MIKYNLHTDKYILGFVDGFSPVIHLVEGYGDDFVSAFADMKELNNEEYPLTGQKPYRVIWNTPKGLIAFSSIKDFKKEYIKEVV